MRSLVLVLVASFTLSCSSAPKVDLGKVGGPEQEGKPPAGEVACPLMPRDELFVAEFLRLWKRALAKDLQLGERPLPWFILVGKECEYHLSPRAEVRESKALTTELKWSGVPVTVHARGHGGALSLPGGKQLPVGIHSFSARTEGDVDYFVLSLMELWAQHPAASKMPNAAEMVLGVALHELMHTTQLAGMARALEGVVPEGADVSDSTIEQTFKADPEYVAAYRKEADALWAAALTNDNDERRRLAAQAVALAKARRARFFTGERAHLAVVDGLMLNLEAMGEWTRLRMLLAADELPENMELERLEPKFTSWRALRQMDDAAITAMLREQTRREWAQESGLALMLVIEKVEPAWRERMLAERPADPYLVLEDALAR